MLACAVLSALAMTGCTKADQSSQKVLAAIDQTEQLARQFVYTDRSGGHTTVVQGSVADDLRYRLVSTIDGKPAASEIVVDDARAMQVSNAGLLKALTTSGNLPAAGQPVSTPSPAAASGAAAPAAPAAVPAALLSGGWVVDRSGATGLTGQSVSNPRVGANPLLDALTALEYVRGAVTAGSGVTKFNPESETYRPKLDPFPRPAADTVRYDVTPPVLQPRSMGAGGQLQVTVPDTAFFRLMAIYVKNGLVVDVREKIDIVTRLEDAQSNLEARLGDFVSVPSSASTQQQAAALEVSLNQQLGRVGKPALRLREMELTFTSLGSSATVAIPSGATAGSLAAVDAHGQLLYEQR